MRNDLKNWDEHNNYAYKQTLFSIIDSCLGSYRKLAYYGTMCRCE